VEATWELDNPYAAQPLQFIIQVSGGASVSDVTLEIDGSGEILIPATLAPGSILKYSGRGQGTVYDRTWNELEEVDVRASELQMDPGRHEIRLQCRFLTADQPEVKLECRTIGEPERLTLGTSTH
jgi:hypothetical protein